MKNKYVAAILRFLIAGLGLVYLGLWKQAGINLVLAFGIGVLFAILLPESSFAIIDGPLALGIGIGSGIYARVKAEEMNARAIERPTMERLAREANLV